MKKLLVKKQPQGGIDVLDIHKIGLIIGESTPTEFLFAVDESIGRLEYVLVKSKEILLEKSGNRIEEIEAILKNCEILKPPPKHKRHIVHLGATVEVEIDGQKDEFTIVAPVEADPMAGKISHESPVGRALLGRSIGEKVVVQSSIRAEYKIRKITYKSIK